MNVENNAFASVRKEFQDEKDDLWQRLDEAQEFNRQCQAVGLKSIEDLEKIASLRQRASRVDEVEKEILELRARPESESSCLATGSTVDTEGYQRAQRRLADFERDYGKLVVAKNTIEAMCRCYRNLTKDWQAYAQALQSKYGKIPKAQNSTGDAPGNTSTLAVEEDILLNEPTPPLVHGPVLSPSRSPSTASRLALSRVKAESGLRSPVKPHSPSQSDLPENPSSAPKHGAPMQDTHPLPASETNTETTDNSDDFEQQAGAETRVKGQQNPTPPKTKALTGLTGDDSDPPIVVSERSLKRKRASPTAKNHSKVQMNGYIAPGSAVKPLRIKSEPGSSSPAVPDAGIGFGNTNDSLDLDDVGDRLLTPRKRRRLELRRMKSSMLKASTATETGEVLLEYGVLDVNSEFDNGDLDCSFGGADEQSSEQFRDREYYMRKGEEYGMRLWEEEQRKPAENRKQAELDAKVPEWLRGSKNNIRAQQFLQNEKTGNRRARIEAEEQAMQASIDSTSNIPQSPNLKNLTILQDQPIKEGDVEISTDRSEQRRERGPQQGINERRAKPTKPAILRTKDPNHQILPRTSEHLRDQKRLPPNGRRDDGAPRIAFMAEDGENLDARNSSRSPKEANSGKTDTSGAMNKTPKAPAAHHRLGDLLAKPSPENSLLYSGELGSRVAKPSRTPPARSIRSTDFGTPTNQRASSSRVTRSNNTATKTKPLFTRPPRSNSPSTILPSHEPLRARPVRRLRAEDFKPNPTYNQGRDYAFSEVVRARAQRQCLPGCDKPHCCGGQLRKMVQISGFTPARKSLLGAPPTPQEDADEDDRVLLDYLGSSGRARLKRMGDEEKKELLLKAKTKAFADEYGRHRQAYGRAPTPPGFWRTDMPSTQEEEEDRRQAWCLERVRVEEMYREAKRDGGPWQFRDE